MNQKEYEAWTKFHDRLDGIVDRFAIVMHRRLYNAKTRHEQKKLIDGWNSVFTDHSRFMPPTWWKFDP